jgi:hypothetical protein
VVVLCGCGLANPYRSTTSTTAGSATPPTKNAPRPPAADQRDPAPERGGTIPNGTQTRQDKLAAEAAPSTPQAALARYAAIYLNWDAAHVVAIQHRLAAISLGQAHAQAQQAAASAGRDRQLTTSKVQNRGWVIAITSGRAAAAGRWVIVTSEQTAGQGDYQGLPATLHVIYAQLSRTSHGWVVSQWQPQN